MSGGWSPTLHLTSHRGHKPRWDESARSFVPDDLPPGMTVAGAANGDFTLADALATGARHGRPRPTACGLHGTLPSLPASTRIDAARAAVGGRRRAQGKCFLDFQNDVTADDIELAEREASARSST